MKLLTPNKIFECKIKKKAAGITIKWDITKVHVDTGLLYRFLTTSN